MQVSLRDQILFRLKELLGSSGCGGLKAIVPPLKTRPTSGGRRFASQTPDWKSQASSPGASWRYLQLERNWAEERNGADRSSNCVKIAARSWRTHHFTPKCASICIFLRVWCCERPPNTACPKGFLSSRLASRILFPCSLGACNGRPETQPSLPRPNLRWHRIAKDAHSCCRAAPFLGRRGLAEVESFLGL